MPASDRMAKEVPASDRSIVDDPFEWAVSLNRVPRYTLSPVACRKGSITSCDSRP
jgi:hypothetical protein